MGRLGDGILSRLNTIIRERKALGGPSQRRLAWLIGCSSAHMTHLLTGRSPLTLDWLEKICQALKIDPARLFERRGGPLAHSAYDIYEKPQAALHERFQALLEQGLDAEMAAWLELTEQLLKRYEARFLQLVRNSGAEEGVLRRRRASRTQIVYSSMGPSKLNRFPANPGQGGWMECCRGDFELWLKNPQSKDAEAHSELFLELISDLLPERLLHLAGRPPA